MLKLFFLSAIVMGIIQGIKEMNLVRQNPCLGVKPSTNIFTYLFIDNHE